MLQHDSFVGDVNMDNVPPIEKFFRPKQDYKVFQTSSLGNALHSICWLAEGKPSALINWYSFIKIDKCNTSNEFRAFSIKGREN